MTIALIPFREDYWESFELNSEDVGFLYNYLLETETPLTPLELLKELIKDRLERETRRWEREQSKQGSLYFPKETYQVGQVLTFPMMHGQQGKVLSIRAGQNPNLDEFLVMDIQMEDGEQRQFAANLDDHVLNTPPDVSAEDTLRNPDKVLKTYQKVLIERLEEGLQAQPDFVRIAGRWFPRALLVDINIGHLNLTEAVLDMNGGGPLPTPELIQQIELSLNENPKLVEFSMDLALQEDPRFDEIGPVGKVLWFLKRLEPEQVQNTPVTLQYQPREYDRSVLTAQMLQLEQELQDELSPLAGADQAVEEVSVTLPYFHWRAGTLPLSNAMQHLFPTAYETPRIRFMLVDGKSKDKFPGWVVRPHRYVFGLDKWYQKKGLFPGNHVIVQRGKLPGEVIVTTDNRRKGREWVRTVLVGVDGGIVYAMLKQNITATFDDRMMIAVPDYSQIDQVWEKRLNHKIPFEKIVVETLRELAKLNPQGHVHAAELYAAVNVAFRCPPGPLFALLATRPWFVHVGDLHFRLSDDVEV